MYQALASLFGFDSFRPHQEAIVQAILDRRDTFTVMPTGGGKSLCYQLPAHLSQGVCIVVSPLISLMKDQVDAARITGLKACSLNSSSSSQERAQAFAGLRDGSLDLLYVSPERLRVPAFLEALHAARLSFFAIDEAHCMSEWGHDFRPDYLALSNVRLHFPEIPIAAFTATATERVERDIVERLGLRDPFRIRASFNRENLFYHITPKEDVEEQILAFVRHHQGESGIVYRMSRKAVETTASRLRAQGIQALAYHAGMSDAERTAVQDAFSQDECPVIVATIAFGMGIDKSNVRFVLHGDLPKNPESYYQETGRAGRDGAPAQCVLFYGRQDIARLLSFAEALEDEQAREIAKQQLYAMLDFTQKDGCRRKALLAYFGETFPHDNCGACDVCTGAVRREDATTAAQKLLSAMVRTECRFGAGHSIRIVMGKDSARMRSLGHDKLPTFGVGRDMPESYWRRVMDTLLAQGLIMVTDAQFPVPVITDSGWEVLRGQRTCSIVTVAESRGTRAGRDAVSGTTSPLFALLKEERRRLARMHGVPPYVIFADSTLIGFCRSLPDTPEAMLEVSGVGRHRLDNYGEHMLIVIRAWREEHPADAARADSERKTGERPLTQISGSEYKEAVTKPSKEPSWMETSRLLETGMTPEAVAEARNLKLSTIYTHMEQMAAQGMELENRGYIAPDRLALIRDLFMASEGWNLTPVVELSRVGLNESEPGGVSYEEARLARMFLNQEAARSKIDSDAL